MKTAIEEMRAQLAEEQRKTEAECAILELLPDDLPSRPTISNISSGNRTDDEVHAWLSFRGPSYDPENKHNPVAILESLERGGFELVPATLCKWDNYRRSPYPGALEDVPQTKPGSFGRAYELNDSDAIAPLWIKPCTFTGVEVVLYMKKRGKLFQVSLSVRLPCYITARRREFRGDWSYERGTARLQFPQNWHSLEHCTISQHTQAYVDTDQGTSGTIYFMPHDEQAAWPLKASEFLASLMETK